MRADRGPDARVSVPDRAGKARRARSPAAPGYELHLPARGVVTNVRILLKTSAGSWMSVDAQTGRTGVRAAPIDVSARRRGR